MIEIKSDLYQFYREETFFHHVWNNHRDYTYVKVSYFPEESTKWKDVLTRINIASDHVDSWSYLIDWLKTITGSHDSCLTFPVDIWPG